MGDSSGVFPVAIGIIVFIVILTSVLTIDSFQQTTVYAPEDVLGKDISDPSQLLGTEFVDWIPGTGARANATNISDNYFNSGVQTYGPNFLNMQFTDPNYGTHRVDVRIIRNNSWFGQPLYEQRPGIAYSKYQDFMAFDGYVYDWGIHWNEWWKVASYETINTSKLPGMNYSVVDIGSYNISAMIMTWGNSSTFITDLYNDNYTIYLVQYPHIDYNDFWQVLWWIISFNNAWMPSAPWIAYIISFIVDIALALLLLFIAQGFIP